jgi:hypothetical protein
VTVPCRIEIVFDHIRRRFNFCSLVLVILWPKIDERRILLRNEAVVDTYEPVYTHSRLPHFFTCHRRADFRCVVVVFSIGAPETDTCLEEMLGKRAFVHQWRAVFFLARVK